MGCLFSSLDKNMEYHPIKTFFNENEEQNVLSRSVFMKEYGTMDYNNQSIEL